MWSLRRGCRGLQTQYGGSSSPGKKQACLALSLLQHALLLLVVGQSYKLEQLYVNIWSIGSIFVA